MEESKRAWIWAGLTIASGIGLVLAFSDRAGGVPPGSRIALVGDGFAQGLATPLGALTKERGAHLHVVSEPDATIVDYATPEALEKIFSDASAPELVLVSLGASDMLRWDPEREARALEALLRALDAADVAVLWVPPPPLPRPLLEEGLQEGDGSAVPVENRRAELRAMLAAAELEVFPSEALDIARGPDGIRPTAAGYAGWAGAIWRWIA